MTAPRGKARLTWVGSLLATVLVLGLITKPSGADPQVMSMIWGAALAVLVIGIIWPQIAVRRITVSASTEPRTAVGESLPVRVTVAGSIGPCEIRLLDPVEAWHRVGQAGTGVVQHVAERRGVFSAVRVEARVSAPLGVVDATRVHWVELPRTVEGAPAPIDVDWQPALAPLSDGVAPPAGPVLSGDLVRSVRPYASGDPAHLVHWPSTARTGTLVVREVEPPVPLGQAIVVDLRDLGPDTERAASYAFGAALAVLARGGELALCTAEETGPVVRRVHTASEAGGCLARATAGVPGLAPKGWPTVEIGV